MRQFDAVLFDLDGTVLDTSEGIVLSIKETIEHFGLPSLSMEEIYTFIGPPVEWSFSSHFGMEGEALSEAVAYFRDRYANINLLLAKPYEGIYDLLQFLKDNDIPIAIATYKKQSYATKLLMHYGFGDYTDIMYGSDPEGTLLKSDIIKLCIDKIGITDNKKVLMVGDSKHDARGAEAIGASFAGVSYGFGFGSTEDIKDYVSVAYVDKPIELIKLFQ